MIRLSGSHFTRTYPIYDAPLFAPCKEIQDSVGFWIPRCRFRIPSTGFRTLSVEFGFQIPIVNGIRDPSSRIPDSKASDFGTSRKSFPNSGFLKQRFLGLRNLDFLTWSDTFETVCKCEQRPYSWFATTWQGGHVGGQYNRIFSRRIYMKIGFSSQRKEMLLFLTTNMAAVTSCANQQSGMVSLPAQELPYKVWTYRPIY